MNLMVLHLLCELQSLQNYIYPSAFEFKLKCRGPIMSYNGNTAYTHHMITNHPLNNKMLKPLLALRIKAKAMGHVIFPSIKAVSVTPMWARSNHR